MSKFLYRTILGTMLLWVCVLVFGYKVSPDAFIPIFVFLMLLLNAMGFTFTILAFIFLSKTSSRFANIHILFRRSLKWGFYASFGITGTLGLKAFDLINALNYGLFLALYLVIYLQLKTKTH